MIFLAGYYVFGMIIMVYGGRVRTFREFASAFGWAFIWPVVIATGWREATEAS